MKGLEKIYVGKSLVAQIIRKNVNLKEGIWFFSSPTDSLQLAHHKYSIKKATRLHHNKVSKPIKLTKKQKYVYMISGTAKVELMKSEKAVKKTLKLSAGDGIIIGDIFHKVIFNAKSKALEIKQGPYEED